MRRALRSLANVNVRALDRGELLAEIARLYYEEGRNQGEIASRVGMSRSNVSRMLEQARRTGVVRIRIAHPLGTVPALEDELCRRFGLSFARVLSTASTTQDPPRTLEKVGRLAAQFLVEHIHAGGVIGISWGTSVEQTVNALEPDRPLAVEVVQLIGGLSRVSPTISGHDLARRTGAALGAPYHYLHAPAIVASSAVRESLLADPSIQRVLDLARRATLAVVGIGTLEHGASRSLLEEAGLSSADRARLRADGVVGDVCARHFDMHGRSRDIGLDGRIVGIEPEDLSRIPLVVGVAASAIKAPAVLGALRGGWVKALVTDEVCAREVCRLAASA